MPLPPLSGADQFHWLVDAEMQRHGLPGNISRILFQLDGPVDALADALMGSTVFTTARSHRPKQSWPKLPRWEHFQPIDTGVTVAQNADHAVWLETKLQQGFAPNEGFIRFDLAACTNGTTYALLSMHHVLFDHQGMVLFLEALEAGTISGPLFPAPVARPWRSELKSTLAAAYHAFASSGPRLASLVKHRSTPQTQYAFIRLNAAQTATLEAKIHTLGTGTSRNAYLMAAVAHAAKAVQQQRGQRLHYLWFGSPHNTRPRQSASQHLLSNDMSFFFFRLMPNQLRDVPSTVNAIATQLVHQVRSGSPTRYAALLRAFRRVPLQVYRAMFNMPSAGRWASFAFSDLGELNRLPTNLVGQRIINLNHYPPVPTPPGLSVVAGTENGLPVITVAYAPSALNDNDLQTFLKEFHVNLGLFE